MEFPTPLLPGRLIRRYNRFLADIALDDGREITAHCPNPGAMLGLKDPGLRVWVEPNDDPKKKLKFGWRVAQTEAGHFVGIDTSVPNRVVKEALEARAIPELAAYPTIRPEQKYGSNSRIDFLVQAPDLPDAYVEVKNVHLLRRSDLAEFPDSVTTRGAKHLRDLAEVATQGKRAVMLYVVQHMGCARFDLAADIDPNYAKNFAIARDAGVEMLCYGCEVSPAAIRLTRSLPVEVG